MYQLHRNLVGSHSHSEVFALPGTEPCSLDYPVQSLATIMNMLSWVTHMWFKIIKKIMLNSKNLFWMLLIHLLCPVQQKTQCHNILNTCNTYQRTSLLMLLKFAQSYQCRCFGILSHGNKNMSASITIWGTEIIQIYVHKYKRTPITQRAHFL